MVTFLLEEGAAVSILDNVSYICTSVYFIVLFLLFKKIICFITNNLLQDSKYALDVTKSKRVRRLIRIAMKRYAKFASVWMSSGICLDVSNILNQLPIDLSKKVIKYL
jgi:hypothetical protein